MDRFTTVKQVIEYVKPLTIQYRKYPSKKEEIIRKLEPIFGPNADAWQLVIDYNKFVRSFHDALGKQGRKALQKLLTSMDSAHYSNVDFDID